MKSLKLLLTAVLGLSLVATPAFAADQPAKCCAKAKESGKECTHDKCCIEAAKNNTVCEKCGGKKDE